MITQRFSNPVDTAERQIVVAMERMRPERDVAREFYIKTITYLMPSVRQSFRNSVIIWSVASNHEDLSREIYQFADVQTRSYALIESVKQANFGLCNRLMLFYIPTSALSEALNECCKIPESDDSIGILNHLIGRGATLTSKESAEILFKNKNFVSLQTVIVFAETNIDFFEFVTETLAKDYPAFTHRIVDSILSHRFPLKIDPLPAHLRRLINENICRKLSSRMDFVLSEDFDGTFPEYVLKNYHHTVLKEFDSIFVDFKRCIDQKEFACEELKCKPPTKTFSGGSLFWEIYNETFNVDKQV